MASIRKRVLPSGTAVWQCDYRDVAGRRRSRQFARKNDADAFLVKARAEVAAGTHVADSASITVEEAAQHWLSHCQARCDAGRRMEKATFRDYFDKVRLHLLDPEQSLATLKLSRLTRRHVNVFRDGLLTAGRSEAMVRKVLSVLRLILKHAMDNQFVHSNAADGVEVIRSSRLRTYCKVPSKAAIRALIDCADEDFQPLLAVAALCGLRASELRGLSWSCVDFQGGYIHVRQRADAYNALGEPKSSAGQRSVPMGPLVANMLRRWRLRCPRSALDLVFPTSRGTIQSHANILHTRWYPLFDAAHAKHVASPASFLAIEKFRWHDLRHFAVSLWIEQGFDVKAITTFAGHSSIQMSYDLYGHLLPSPDHHSAMAAAEARVLGSAKDR